MSETFDFERFTTRDFDSLVEEIEPKSRFLTALCFPNQISSKEKFIEWDIVRKGRPMAPFVAPTVRGRPLARDGFVTYALKPAYVKISTTIDLTRPLSRLPGETSQKPLTPMERFDRLVAEDIVKHKEALDNRLEWMAAGALVNGGYTVVGPEYPEIAIDFGMNPALDVVLAGAATWDQPTSSPVRDIEQMAMTVRGISYGVVTRDIIMDPLAWSLFSKHADVKERLNLDVGRSHAWSQTRLDLGPQNEGYEGGRSVGTLDGRFRIWVYGGDYTDESGASHSYLPDYTVIVVSPDDMAGRQYFGAIVDQDAEYQPVKQFFKSKSQWDPSGYQILSQSAPLVGPHRVQSWGVLRVA